MAEYSQAYGYWMSTRGNQIRTAMQKVLTCFGDNNVQLAAHTLVNIFGEANITLDYAHDMKERKELYANNDFSVYVKKIKERKGIHITGTGWLESWNETEDSYVTKDGNKTTAVYPTGYKIFNETKAVIKANSITLKEMYEFTRMLAKSIYVDFRVRAALVGGRKLKINGEEVDTGRNFHLQDGFILPKWISCMIPPAARGTAHIIQMLFAANNSPALRGGSKAKKDMVKRVVERAEEILTRRYKDSGARVIKHATNVKTAMRAAIAAESAEGSAFVPIVAPGVLSLLGQTISPFLSAPIAGVKFATPVLSSALQNWCETGAIFLPIDVCGVHLKEDIDFTVNDYSTATVAEITRVPRFIGQPMSSTTRPDGLGGQQLGLATEKFGLNTNKDMIQKGYKYLTNAIQHFDDKQGKEATLDELNKIVAKRLQEKNQFRVITVKGEETIVVSEMQKWYMTTTPAGRKRNAEEYQARKAKEDEGAGPSKKTKMTMDIN